MREFDRFLSVPDADRAAAVLRKLVRHNISQWALTGGLAIEIHCDSHDVRPLNDIDFVAASFEQIPDTLAEDFVFRHIHPLEPPGKTMLQAIDPDSGVRIDVFRACGNTLGRAADYNGVRLVSIADVAARAARLSLDLAERKEVPAKYPRDFLRMLDLVTAGQVEEAWADHRKPHHPATFAEAARVLRELIPLSQHLLSTPEYSKDVDAVCERCTRAGSFRLADPRHVMAVLGYC